MRLVPSTIAAVVAAAVAGGVPAGADTVQARCDIFDKGEDRAKASVPCTFSQRQGFVSIDRSDGVRYELKPHGDQPGNYLDPNGKPAYRQSGLGDQGLIFRLATESVFVYWDTASASQTETKTPAHKAAAPAHGVKPSFDCAKAEHEVEKLICADADLAGLDRSLTDLYGKVADVTPEARKKALKTEQIGWIKGRNDCWKASDKHACIKDAYQSRINELKDR